MITKSILILSLFIGQVYASENSKVAIVKVARGKAIVVEPDGKSLKIKKGMWIKEKSTIETQAKSFVRLSFIDKSSMNIGPKSKLKIDSFSKNEAGVINVLTGKIRSQVTKDYLKMDKTRSKLFVKSRNAVMGVRGTDFIFTANAKAGTSSVILFEGSVAFSKIKNGESLRDLERIVNRGRFLKPGQVSVVNRVLKKPTVPAKMNKKQFQKLKENKNLLVKQSKAKKDVKSKVPPGLTGEIVKSESDTLKKIAGDKSESPKPSIESKGYKKGDDIKPADGVVVHIETGTIIPPGKDSEYDAKNGEWVSSSQGKINKTGEYVPPASIEISEDGKILKLDKISKIKKEINLKIGSVEKIEGLSEESKRVRPIFRQDPANINLFQKEGDLRQPPQPVGDTTRPPSLPIGTTEPVKPPTYIAPKRTRVKVRTKIN